MKKRHVHMLTYLCILIEFEIISDDEYVELSTALILG